MISELTEMARGLPASFWWGLVLALLAVGLMLAKVWKDRLRNS